jgi:glycosyltransferase involved in cell wall biosynthesis
VLSVVVPTFNRRDRLERVLVSLAHQDLAEPFEVIVVSDGSTDGTDEYLDGPGTPLQVVALRQRNQGPAAARNLGVERARADIIVFIDDDVVPSPALLRKHLEAHRRRGDDIVVIGPMLNPPEHRMTTWISWEQEMLAKQYQAMEHGEYTATARQFYTGNASLHVHNFRAVGGFDPSLRRAEDVELAFRLADIGLSFEFELDAVGYHWAERSYESWRQTAYTYGRNDIVFARDLGREWLFEFIGDVHSWHHPALRFLTNLCVTRPQLRPRTVKMLEWVITPFADGMRRRIARYALSGVYSIEYHRGVADELGSVDAYRRLLRHRQRP